MHVKMHSSIPHIRFAIKRLRNDEKYMLLQTVCTTMAAVTAHFTISNKKIQQKISKDIKKSQRGEKISNNFEFRAVGKANLFGIFTSSYSSSIISHFNLSLVLHF